MCYVWTSDKRFGMAEQMAAGSGFSRRNKSRKIKIKVDQTDGEFIAA